jgi:hypothetical protein
MMSRVWRLENEMSRDRGMGVHRTFLAVLAAVALAIAACGGESGGDAPTAMSTPAATATGAATTDDPMAWEPKPGMAPLEQETGVYFGVNLDWGNDSTTAFNERLGVQAASWVQFAPFPFDAGWRENLRLYFEQVLAVGGIAVLTLEPTIPLDEITAEQADDLASMLKGWNDQGVGVLLRFAHEMNGSWYGWGQQPEAYIAAFRLVAEAVHATAPGTAMLWAPNYGGGYPFSGGRYEATPDVAGFATLDTNGNGSLDQRDDPYWPYYPGDDAVDWVGLSLYHWGNAYPWGENELPEEGSFIDYLTGAYNGLNGDETAVPDFYRDYADGHDKPMAIVETAALYNTTETGADELEIKRAWWRQVFSRDVSERFPRIRMINWFEWNKVESEIGGDRIDWTITQDATILEAFLSDLPRERLQFAPVVD